MNVSWASLWGPSAYWDKGHVDIRHEERESPWVVVKSAGTQMATKKMKNQDTLKV